MTLLFGGAISVQIPQDFIDAERFRQVPDNQHVFVSSSSNVSIIIELIQMEDGIAQAVDNHYMILSENTRNYSVILQADSYIIVSGQIQISKFNTTQVDTVTLVLGLLRLFDYTTDVLISLNVPEGPVNPMIVADIINSFQLHDPTLFKE